MDEPASALDPIATLAIEELIRELKQLYTIVIVTHNMQQAARVADKTAFLMVDDARGGYLVEYDATSKIFTNPSDSRTEAYITGRFSWERYMYSSVAFSEFRSVSSETI